MWHEIACRIEQVPHAGHGRSFVEAGIFRRRSHQHRPIIPWHEIATVAPDDPSQRRAAPREVKQLTADRTNWNTRFNTLYENLPGPGARRHDDRVAGQRPSLRFHHEIAASG